MEWKFNREESKEFEKVEAGTHRIRIRSAEKAISKASGNDMLALQFEVSGTSALLFHYIVFLADKPEITNRNLTAFFDSFGIKDGDFNLERYVGKAGACQVKIDDQGYAKVQYFINKNKAMSLPPFENKARKQSLNDLTEVEIDGEMPF